ncbi:MAG: cadmium-translocating P-type ATPase [Eggerthellaceae bacterium]|nr:cadmium-translocating P-type ATPase [Eggerthellaceae bacterium]MBQ9044289.1 cadmium-translocating P-type ATPase [Eggerthellaceae bacterium]
MNKKQKKKLRRIVVALVIFVVLEALEIAGVFDSLPYGLWIEFAAFLVPYLIAGYDVLRKAWHGIVHRQPFDENLLMSIATIGAFALVFFPDAEPHMAEGAAVMLFYQVGELFESYAVGKTRKSIADMMDIAPDYANIMQDGELVQVDPADVAIGDEIVVKVGERIPLDGVVVSGRSQLDTSALTGESVPRVVEEGASVTSGCVNMTGVLTVRTTSAFENSTVQRILELVENASEKKARTENFISRFARVYTPIVVGLALAIAVFSPLAFGFSISGSVKSALIFLVVSCPCALVISVPLSFFGGIGAASRSGILVKGSSYLEALAQVDTIAFDKTGTLTNGTFGVVAVHATEGIDQDLLLSYAAHAEAYSDHPIALSVVASYAGTIDREKIAEVEELGGQGVSARVDSHRVLIGNDALMKAEDIDVRDCHLIGTILHVAVDGEYLGHIIIADMMKDDAKEAIDGLHAAGVRKTVMLTGDREEAAAAVAAELGVDEYRAQLMPQDKVAQVEALLEAHGGNGKVAFVGDGINDAPVLMRADVGIAMGGMGSDAAIEAADIVLMDDKPSQIARAIRIARKTLRIVKQNIVFALGVKVVIMILALPMIGIATMWLAVFGDVGVSVLAILNAMRCLSVQK